MPNGVHLALIGLPGAGKSTVAALAGARLGRRTVDFDQEIERREGKTITQIFSQRGEEYFRDLEASLTLELRDVPAAILSPGGGWVTRPETVEIVGSRTRLVWLRVSPKASLARLQGNRMERPLLMKGDPETVLTGLLDMRRVLYEASDAALDTEVLTLHEVVSQVAQLATFWDSHVG